MFNDPSKHCMIGWNWGLNLRLKSNLVDAHHVFNSLHFFSARPFDADLPAALVSGTPSRGPSGSRDPAWPDFLIASSMRAMMAASLSCMLIDKLGKA